MLKLSIFFSFSLFFHSILFANSSANVSSQFAQNLKQQLELIDKTAVSQDKRDSILSSFIHDFYAQNNYRLAWQNRAMIERLLKAITDSKKLGLLPEDYDYKKIQQKLTSKVHNYYKQRSEADIFMTKAFFRLIYNMRFGKVLASEMDQDWNIKRQFLTNDPVSKLIDILASEQKLNSFLNQLTNLGPLYSGLIKALEFYQNIKLQGGWQTIANGEAIKPMMKERRLPSIKARLLINGYLDYNDNSFLYDDITEEGIKRFQSHYNLEVDGVIGNGTIQQMNIPVEQRIEQIKANLERVRWVKPNLTNEFVLVNVASYKAYYLHNNKLLWTAKVQVGKDYRKTPIFSDEIEYIVLNPTWTVPPTILSKDILPKIKKDPSYLQKKNMNVVTTEGEIIDSRSIDWSSMTAKNFPYMIRQEPGPKNALGRVKIMFPNEHLVYLHDTPSKSLFDRTDRAFSSGCIRVERPFELVELLLKDSEQWNQSSFARILESGQLKNIKLPVKVPVLLLYFTAQLDADGHFSFFQDIYERDQKIITGLKKPFRLVLPDH